MPKLSLEETIKAYTNENGFAWGINTVMKSLAPGVSHDLYILIYIQAIHLLYQLSSGKVALIDNLLNDSNDVTLHLFK